MADADFADRNFLWIPRDHPALYLLLPRHPQFPRSLIPAAQRAFWTVDAARLGAELGDFNYVPGADPTVPYAGPPRPDRVFFVPVRGRPVAAAAAPAPHVRGARRLRLLLPQNRDADFSDGPSATSSQTFFQHVSIFLLSTVLLNLLNFV